MTPEEAARLADLERRLNRLEKTFIIAKTVIVGLVIGMGITALIFGIITVKEAHEVINTLK